MKRIALVALAFLLAGCGRSMRSLNVVEAETRKPARIDVAEAKR